MPLEDSGKTGDSLVTNQETITTSMDQPSVGIPQPREAPSHTPVRGTGITAPQQTSQSQRLFADTQPQVIITDPLTGPKAPYLADVQDAAFTNLGGMHGGQHSFDRACAGVASNMYPDTIGLGATSKVPITQDGGTDTMTPTVGPPVPAGHRTSTG